MLSPQVEAPTASGRRSSVAGLSSLVSGHRARVLILTPAMGGADGISEMTRQWVRALEPLVGPTIESLEVCSLDDASRPDRMLGVTTRFRTARGRRLHF